MLQPGEESGKRKVLIVDDHPIVRRGVRTLVTQEPDLTVCGEADNTADALRAIAQTKPDVAIVDLSLKDSNGLELIKDVRIRYPELPVLVLSWRDESFAERALRAGARGYVTKQEAVERVIEGIHRILDGGIYVSEKLASKIISEFVERPAEPAGPSVHMLSDRELGIFEMIGRGIPTRKIAEELHISVKTVESHRAHIKKKLKIDNATELLKRAMEWVQSQQGG